MIGSKSWKEIKAESKQGWNEMRELTFKQLLTQCLAGFSLAMLAGFALAAIILY